MDRETFKLWEQSIEKPKEITKFTETAQFLETRFQSLEMMQSLQTINYHHTGRNNELPTNRIFTTKRTICAYCASECHVTFKCTKFSQMSAKDRVEWAQKTSKCTN